MDLQFFHIDSINGTYTPNPIKIFPLIGFHEQLYVTGWAKNLNTGKPFSQIKILVNQKPVKVKRLKRNDINTSTSTSNKFGFSFTVNKNYFTENQLQIQLKFIDKKTIKNASFIVDFQYYEPWFNHSFANNNDVVSTLSKDELIFQLQQQLITQNADLFRFKNSLSWKITKPVRLMVDIFLAVKKIVNVHAIKLFWLQLKYVGLKEALFNWLFATNSLNKNYFQYKLWIESVEKQNIKKLLFLANNLKEFPKISIVTPVYNVEPKWLNACIQSVINQQYKNWELCLYDDASNNQNTIKALKQWENKHPQIKVAFGSTNYHISEASNQALKMATGSYIGFLDHDDLLAPHALQAVAVAIENNSAIDIIYSDEDKITLTNQRIDPYFKPDFNYDLLLSCNYFNHFTVIKHELIKQVGGFRIGFEGSQDYDLFLRCVELAKNVHHIPQVLYHWRKIPGSTADTFQSKSYPDKAAQNALTEHVERIKEPAKVELGLYPGTYRIIRKINNPKKITIIIPFKDQVNLLKTCLTSIYSNTVYQNFEVLLVNNQSVLAETQHYLSGLTYPNCQVIAFNEPFNYSKINNFAVKQTDAPYVLFLNNDIEIKSKGWLTEMASHLHRKDVGAVGTKLLYPDYTIQHAGVILGIGGVAGHSHKYFSNNHHGYFSRPHVIQNLSACTAACLLVKKEIFEKVGGFDEENLKIAFNDIDLCLKIGQTGNRIVYTPFTEIIHHESKSRGHEDTPEKKARFEKEVKFMKQKWGKTLQNDPAYNSNLTLTHEDFSINT